MFAPHAWINVTSVTNKQNIGMARKIKALTGKKANITLMT